MAVSQIAPYALTLARAPSGAGEATELLNKSSVLGNRLPLWTQAEM